MIGADARCCHEPSHLSIVACQPHHLAVEVCNLLLDSLACLEQRPDRGGEFWPILDQLRGACAEASQRGPKVWRSLIVSTYIRTRRYRTL